MKQEQSPPGLTAGSVSLPEVLFQSVAFMAPGIGIAFAIGIGVPLTGGALPLSLIIALVACSLTALAIGQLASRIPSAGGLYAYATEGLGKRAGITVGWYYLALAVLLPPFFALQEGWFVDAFLRGRGVEHLPPVWVWVVIYLAILVGLTYFNVTFSVRTAMVLGGAEILVFLVLGITVIGDGTISSSPFESSSAPGGWSGITQGAVFAILAFIGFEAAASFGEEAANPKRAIPLAVFVSSVAVGVFYLFLTYAWSIGAPGGIVKFHAATGGADWDAFAERAWGSVGAWIIFLALLNSIIAAGASAMNSCARVLFAMGRSGQLPAALGRVHSKHRTPHVAVIASTLASALVSLLAGLKFGAAVGFGVVGAAFTILAIVIYMILCVACVRYFSSVAASERKVWLHVIVPTLGLLAFVLPLYAQAFDLNALLNDGRFFDWAAVYPFNWAVWTAIIWITLGLVVVALNERRSPSAPDASVTIKE